MSMKKISHVTLDDIARRLKVSRVTVSKALRGHPDIADDTAARVRKTAEEMHYSPNIIARSLSARRSHMIGLVVPKIAHFFFGSVIEGVYDAAFHANYETILTVSQENPDRERKHLQALVSMRVDGIIISISQETRDLEVFSWIRKTGIPLLFLDRCPDPPIPGFNSVTCDDFGGTSRAIEHAISLGYREIACIGGNTHINIGRQRLDGFTGALQAHGLPIREEWMITGGFGTQAGHDGFLQLRATKRVPELIFAMTYPIALGVYEAAREVGLKIPSDVDVLSFGDSDVGKMISPALSCVRQPSYELGSKGVELLLKLIGHPEAGGDQRLVLPTELLLRETCTGKNLLAPAARPADGASRGAA
jgi:LacI family transcriptional regulator